MQSPNSSTDWVTCESSGAWNVATTCPRWKIEMLAIQPLNAASWLVDGTGTTYAAGSHACQYKGSYASSSGSSLLAPKFDLMLPRTKPLALLVLQLDVLLETLALYVNASAGRLDHPSAPAFQFVTARLKASAEGTLSVRQLG